MGRGEGQGMGTSEIGGQETSSGSICSYVSLIEVRWEGVRGRGMRYAGWNDDGGGGMLACLLARETEG